MDSGEKIMNADHIRGQLETTADLLRSYASEKAGAIAAVSAVIAECIDRGGMVLFAGNGGSASQAQHAAAELVGRFEMERKGYGAVALNTDTSVLTSVANDYGYERVFERQVEALGGEGDVFVGLSTSGKSPNVIRAMELAKKMKMTNVALTGPEPGNMGELADYILDVDGAPTWRIQEVHLATLHSICANVEIILTGKNG